MNVSTPKFKGASFFCTALWLQVAFRAVGSVSSALTFGGVELSRGERELEDEAGHVRHRDTAHTSVKLHSHI